MNVTLEIWIVRFKNISAFSDINRLSDVNQHDAVWNGSSFFFPELPHNVSNAYLIANWVSNSRGWDRSGLNLPCRNAYGLSKRKIFDSLTSWDVRYTVYCLQGRLQDTGINKYLKKRDDQRIFPLKEKLPDTIVILENCGFFFCSQTRYVSYIQFWFFQVRRGRNCLESLYDWKFCTLHPVPGISASKSIKSVASSFQGSQHVESRLTRNLLTQTCLTNNLTFTMQMKLNFL
jgi:hypothetical protein